MSINSELQRISTAKTALKSAISSRGVQIQDADTIDTYCEHLNSCPFAVRGTFTPEEDTQMFSISGLAFAPKTIHIFSSEIESEPADKGIRFLAHGKGVSGCTVALKESDSSWVYNLVSKNSSLANWTDDSYTIDLSKSANMSGKYCFLAGYTYEYYISGGYVE